MSSRNFNMTDNFGGFNYFQKGLIFMDKTALILTIIGAINWGLIGIFGFDLVGALFGGQMAVFSRIIFTLVGIAGLWAIGILFKDIVAHHTTT